MLRKLFLTLFTMCTLITVATAKDRIGVAEPVAKGGLDPTSVEAVWGMLEASIGGDDYELISRSSFKQMLTEIGLAEGSDLVNLNDAQKAKLGEIKTVKYILISHISKIGSRINLSLMLVDASTGEIDPERKANETFVDMDELNDQLKDVLDEMGLGIKLKTRGKSAMLSTIVKLRGPAPEYLKEDFNAILEAQLLESNVRLQNLSSVNKILAKNKIDALDEVEPATYRRIGELLRVDFLIQPKVTRHDLVMDKVFIAASQREILRCSGNIEGNVRIIDAKTGEVVGSIPFRMPVDFNKLRIPSANTVWTVDDYGKYMIETLIPQITPNIVKKLK